MLVRKSTAHTETKIWTWILLTSCLEKAKPTLEKANVMLNFSTFNLSKYNISSRKKTEGPKLFSLDIFGLELEKATVLWFFYISTYKFFQIKFCPKIKILKFGTKIVLIGYFGMDFQKLLNFSILEFVNMQSFIQKQRNFKLGTKNTLLRYFWTEI